MASKEVILSAGPYHTPKLLQLSGIGPKALLDSFNISQQANLPVGQRAQVLNPPFAPTHLQGRETCHGLSAQSPEIIWSNVELLYVSLMHLCMFSRS